MNRALICGAFLAATIVCSAPHAARACGFHGLLGNGFSAQYPGSIDVAIALREAADANLIDAGALAPKKANLLAYHRTVQRLQNLSDTFLPTEMRSKSFSLLLVESALWSRYVSEGERLSVNVHTSGPERGDVVLITGEPVIIAITSGQLSWHDAVRRNLVMLAVADQ